MSSTLFKDFDDGKASEDLSNRYVNTPTIEQIYALDKKAVDDFLSPTKQDLAIKQDELSKKKPEDLTGAEKLYLEVAKCFDLQPLKRIDGTESLFSFLWGVIKRFFGMIGNFFKWLGEVFFGFGKKSKTAVSKLQTMVKAGEINYDTEVDYPPTAKMILDSHKYKSYPNNLDWLRTELDSVTDKIKGCKESFKEAKNLFAKVQDKRVTLDDVVGFGNKVAKLVGAKLVDGKEAGKKNYNASKLVGSTWIGIQTDPQNHILSFDIVPIKPTEPTESSKFSVSESVFKAIVEKLDKNAEALTEIGRLSEEEKSLFGIRIKDAKDLEGMGKAEAYAMTAAVSSLVNFISFIKNILSVLQRSDTATHDIMKKVFK